jgi:hypothetical protein
VGQHPLLNINKYRGKTMTALTAQDFAAYAVEVDDFGASYPAIQATNYRPLSLKDKIQLCIAESSYEKMDDAALTSLSEHGEMGVAVFDREGTETSRIKLGAGIRFVALGIPSIFFLNKEENTILPRDTKVTLGKGSGIVTVTRLPLLVVLPDGNLLLNIDGEPQIFTLKLKSSKTMLVTGNRKDKEFKCLRDVQKGLQKHYRLSSRQGCLHLASLSIVAKPSMFSDGKDSSLGVLFALSGGAKELDREKVLPIVQLMQQPETMQLLKDPFGLDSAPIAESSPEEEYSPDTFDGDITF